MSEHIDNGQQHIDALKTVIKGLHSGADVAAVKAQLKQLVQETTSDDIVRMEQQLMDEGMPAEEVKRMCDLHSQVLREVLSPRLDERLPAGHPLDVFQKENKELQKIAQATRGLVAELAGVDAGDLPALIERWRAAQESLLELEKHYARKENLLFPFLEQHGVQGPSQVMWAKDDDVRELLRSLREALAEQDVGMDEWRIIAEQVALPLCDAVEEMIYKEENILLPMSQRKLTDAQWAQVHHESGRFGYTLIEPGTEYQPVLEEDAVAASTGARIDFSAGALTPAQLRGIVGVLPIDMTFVDADDRVGFFSEGPDRVFPRPKAVIGRKVHNCHPPKSVHMVEQILSDFKAGTQDVAEFWIELHGMFVHIRYFAVRDEARQYLGTLEVTQNIAPLRALQGQRRLLEYSDRAAEA